MDMSGEQRIKARQDVVWAAINDVDVLKQCIPGCESVEKISDDQLTAKVTLKIGPVKASFAGKVTFSDVNPPNGCTITGEGSGGMAGFAKGGATISLTTEGDETVLRYEVKADVGGKIAQLGGRLIDSTAKKLAGEFFAVFGEVLAPKDAPTEGEAPEGEPKKKGWFSSIVKG